MFESVLVELNTTVVFTLAGLGVAVKLATGGMLIKSDKLADPNTEALYNDPLNI